MCHTTRGEMGPVALLLHEDVLRLEVSMPELDRVEVGHPSHDGVEAPSGLLLAEALWKTADEIVHQVAACHELLNHLDFALLGHPGDEDLVDAKALWVVHLLEDQDLVHLALCRARVA